MSLPRTPRNRYTLIIRTIPEGAVEIQFTCPDDARDLLIAQAAHYAGHVTEFRATLINHTEQHGQSTEHNIHWRAVPGGSGLQQTVVDDLRHTLARRLLADLDEDLQRREHEYETRPLVRAEWERTGMGYSIDDVPASITLADSTELNGWDALLTATAQNVADRNFIERVFRLGDDDHLIICRDVDGTITCTGDADFTDSATVEGIA